MDWGEITEKPDGAHFCWADLHVHTPDGPGFRLPTGWNVNNDTDTQRVAKAYIDEAIKRDICLLGITEHNDVTWVDRIREAAQGSSVTVFPGFEITANTGGDGVHLVCLFDPAKPEAELDAMLSYFGLTPNKRFTQGRRPAIAEASFEKILEYVKEEGGICIAAHATSGNGLLRSSTLEGGMRIRCFTNPTLLALEIPAAPHELGDFEKNAIGNKLDDYQRTFRIACINSSDAKSLEEIGTKRTFIKLSSYNIEGLRQAFLDWGSRIRLQDQVLAPKFSKIVAATWQGGFLDGLQIHFNENMNCLIGGRGTGKTTIVETIRYALDSKPRTERNRDDHDQILKNVFRNGSRVSLLVESHYPVPKRYVVERIYPYEPVIRHEDGQQVPDLKIGDVFRAEVYGHKEIYEISKNPAFQFALIERFTEDRIAGLKERERKLIGLIDTNKTELTQLRKQLAGFDEELAELPRLEERLERFASLKIQDRLEEHSKFDTESALLNQGLRKIDDFASALRDFKSVVDLDTAFLDEAEISGLPNVDLLREARDILQTLGLAVNEATGAMQSTLNDIISKYKGEKGVFQKWKLLYEELTERFKENLGQLQSEYPDVDLSEFLETETRVRALRISRKERKKVETKFTNHLQRREVLLSELYENRQQQFITRDKVVKEINAKLDGLLKVELTFEGYTTQLKNELRSLRSGIRSEHIDRIVDSNQFSIQKLVKAIKEGHESLAETFDIPQSSALNLIHAFTEEALYDLETKEIPTKASIQLNLGTKTAPNYREIDHLSAGQKCTALLALVLLESPDPLIIDQLEEDLDNTFIVEDIVQRLRSEKERRQFIITTHNANIPVLGDAELITALEADNERAYLFDGNYGSIDEYRVKEKVEKTLEGGEQAFSMRKEKYGI